MYFHVAPVFTVGAVASCSCKPVRLIPWQTLFPADLALATRLWGAFFESKSPHVDWPIFERVGFKALSATCINVRIPL